MDFQNYLLQCLNWFAQYLDNAWSLCMLLAAALIFQQEKKTGADF